MRPSISSLRVTDVTYPCCGSRESSICARGYDYEYETSPDQFTLVRCKGCSVLFLNPRPALSELDRIYPQKYEPYHFNEGGMTFAVRNWLEMRKARSLTRHLTKGARILDGGCGGATFLNCLNRVGAGKWELWGNDIGDDACQRLATAGYSVAIGRFEELPLPDSFFDMITLKQVIEHLDNPRAVFGKAFTLLKRGGELVVETPNSNSWDAHLFKNGTWGGFHFPRHWTIFDGKTLSELGKEAGFAIKSIEFLLSPAFWVQSIHHLLCASGKEWWSGFFSVRNPIPVSLACACDLLQKSIRGTTSNMRIIFSVPP